MDFGTNSRMFVAAMALLGAACSADGGGGPERAGVTQQSLDRAEVDGYFATPTAWIVKPGHVSSLSWRYTLSAPPANWAQPGFSHATWKSGSPGFGVATDTMPGDRVRTSWPDTSSDIWLRTTFGISASDIPKAVLWARWDDTLEVYINGVKAAEEAGWSSGYRYLGLTAAGRAAIRSGSTNILAVHVKDTGGGRYFDLGITRNTALLSMPSVGFERTPQLAQYFTNVVREYMIEHGIPAGALTVMKGDTIVVNRGFGFKDKAMSIPLGANPVLRHASNDKVLTGFALQTLIDAGTVDPLTGQTLSSDTLVFPLLAAHGLTPIAGRTPHPWVNQITVGQLRAHQSGVPGFPADAEFYADLGIAPGTSTIEDNARWLYSVPPSFEPGSAEEYSSTGYFLLRYLIQTLTGEDYLSYLRNSVLAPAGTSDVFLAHERLAGREPREPFYATLEPSSDRWIGLENFLSTASTTEAFMRALRRYHFGFGTPLIDPATGQWAAVPDNGGGVFFGGMPGTFTVSEQRRWDEVSLAVFFNISGAYDGLWERLHDITNSIPDDAWGLDP